jgi:hypothetical protein
LGALSACSIAALRRASGVSSACSQADSSSRLSQERPPSTKLTGRCDTPMRSGSSSLLMRRSCRAWRSMVGRPVVWMAVFIGTPAHASSPLQ